MRVYPMYTQDLSDGLNRNLLDDFAIDQIFLQLL